MINERVQLELHFSIRENSEKMDPFLSDVWKYTLATNNGCMMQLMPEFLIFYAVCHMCQHMIHGGLGVRPFIDLWLLTNKTRYDKDILNTLLVNSELDVFFYNKSISLADYWLKKNCSR